MAKHFKEAREVMERDGGHVSGIVHLTEEARDMRNAGRQLESEQHGGGEHQDLVGAVKELQEAVEETRRSNEAMAEQMSQMLFDMKGMMDEIKSIRSDAEDGSRIAERAAESGMRRVQKQVEEMAVKGIVEVTERNKAYIDKKVQEAKRRIERLAMITVPDKLFQFFKWTSIILLLFILSHIAWSMVA